jgi:hypothetical protein
MGIQRAESSRPLPDVGRLTRPRDSIVSVPDAFARLALLAQDVGTLTRHVLIFRLAADHA